MTRWQTVQLRHLTQCLDGRRVPLNSEQRAEAPGDYPYWGANGIVDTVGDYLFDESLILLGEDGAPFGDPLKDVAFLVEGRVWVNNHIHALRPSGGVDQRFLTYALNSVDWPRFISGSTREKLTQDDMNRVRVECPDRGTQRAIADYLDTETARIDALITKKQRMIERLLERRRATTAAGVAGGFEPAEQAPAELSWLDSCPAHWRTAKLTLVARLGSGHTPSRSHPEWWVDCTVPWVTTGEVAEMRTDRLEYVIDTREKVSILGLANSAAVVRPAGTVVLCRTASAGYSAIMSTDMATSQDFATWTCGPLLRPRYLLLCLRAMRGDLLGRLAMGSTHKTIYMPDIEAIRIPLPSLEEQDRIVEQTWKRLHRIDGIVDATQRQIGLLREHRQALITAAVTGELEIPGVAA